MPLQNVPLDQIPVVGVLDREVTPTGLAFRRLPSWTRSQLVDPSLQLVVAMPAGARVAFTSATSVLELDVAMTGVRVGDLPMNHPAFDVVVDGVVRSSVSTEDHATYHIRGPLPTDLEVLPGGPATVRFEDLPADPAVPVEIWLPHAATVEIQAVRVEEGTTLAPVERSRRRWVHHGSSISHCLEAPTPTETWPSIVARRAGVDLLGLGFGGQCMLDQHTARAMRDADADLISLKAGINVVNGDTMRERTYRAALHGFLDTVRDGHPDTPFLVVTPIVCPAAEDHPGPTVLRPDLTWGVVERPQALSVGSLTLRRVRELMTEVVATRRADGDKNLHLLDGLELFDAADVHLMPDALHPNAEGYRLMADRFYAAAFESGPFA